MPATFLMVLALCPKSRVDLVSSSLSEAGEQQMTIVVLELPPSDSWKISFWLYTWKLKIVKPKSKVQSPKVKTKRTWADTKITWAWHCWTPGLVITWSMRVRFELLYGICFSLLASFMITWITYELKCFSLQPIVYHWPDPGLTVSCWSSWPPSMCCHQHQFY